MNKRIMFLLAFLILLVFCSGAQAVELFDTGKVNIHGFISQGYLFSDENNFFADTKDDGSFQYNEAGINFSCDVSERLNLGLQLFSRDLGQMGGHEVTIDWAYADFSFYDCLHMKAGKIKIPYGLYNTERDVDMLRTFVFLPQSVYYEGWRDTVNTINGVGLYGYLGAGFLGNFRYDSYMGTAILEPNAGVSRMVTDQTAPSFELEFLEINVEYTNAGSLEWDSIFGLEGLKIVASLWDIKFEAESEYNNGGIIYQMVPNLDKVLVPLFGHGGTEGTDYMFDNTDRTTAVRRADAAGYIYKARSQSTFHVRALTSALSLEYAYNNLVFAAEVMQNEYDLVLDLRPIDEHFKTLGWYSSLTYRFTDWLELGTYYSEYYADADDKDGKKSEADYKEFHGYKGGASQAHQEYLKDICLTARFDISSNWVFKIEGHKMEGASLLYSYDGNMNAEGQAEYEKDWYLGAAKVTFSF